MVVIYTLLTGPTLPWVAARLGVTQRGEPRDIEVEAAPLERIAADLLQVNITRRSRLHGVEVGELRLPVGASVSLLVRDGQTLVPDQRTVLRRGDDMLVVTPRKAAGGDRGPAARGVPAGPAGRLAGGRAHAGPGRPAPVSRRLVAVAAGTHTDDDCRTTITRLALDSLLKPSPTTTSMPGPEVGAGHHHLGPPAELPGHEPAERSFFCVVYTRTRLTLPSEGALPTEPAVKPRAVSIRIVLVGPAAPGAGVEHAHLHLLGADPLALLHRLGEHVGDGLAPAVAARDRGEQRLRADEQAERRGCRRSTSRVTAVVRCRRRHRRSVLGHVHAGVQDVPLLEGGPQRPVQAVLEVEVAAPLHDVREQVAEERGVLVEERRELQGVLGGRSARRAAPGVGAARPSPAERVRGPGTACCRRRA